jgi:hypothetical protein
MSFRLATLGLVCGLAAAACSYETRTVVVQPADDSCALYGFTPGTYEYRQCTDREAEARRRGRMVATYGEARILADARDSCSSYGLVRGTDRYDRCVEREVNYRRPA